ncbi:MAG: cysteate racemase [Thermincolia bacterium]
MNKTIGILGGMGPMATADLLVKIIQNTLARTDQEHPRIIIDNNPKIPSRIQAILAAGEDPLPQMQKSTHLLEKAGVDFILIPCCTAHFWLKDLQQKVRVPIYSMIEATLDHVKKKHQFEKILLLASTATVQTSLYQKGFQSHGLNLFSPTPDEQKIVATVITKVKAGFIEANPYLKPLNQILQRYKAKGVSTVLGGCTEVPLLFPYLEGGITTVDPTLILARLAVARAK